MAVDYPQDLSHTPSVVTIGVPDQAALIAVMERLVRYGIRFSAFYEPDFGMGLSAISTVPLTKKQRYALSTYPLWEPRENTRVATAGVGESQHARTNGGSLEGEGTTPQGVLSGTNFPHQHAGSSDGFQSAGMQISEVEGSSPSPRTSFEVTA
jgi:hypothetical protein